MRFNNKIFFLHNPKAGGTSISCALKSCFKDDDIAPTFDNSPHWHQFFDDQIHHLKNYPVFCGHYGFNAYKALSDGHALITNFREPSQRIASLYRYWKEIDACQAHEDDARLVDLAKKLSFPDFIRNDNPDLRLYIDNFHFRQIMGSGWENCSRGFFAKIVAKSRIRSMKWFYICEMPDVSIDLLKQRFSFFKNLDLGKMNVSKGPEINISPEDARFLLSRNELDYEIYAYAVSLQVKRAARAMHSAQLA